MQNRFESAVQENLESSVDERSTEEIVLDWLEDKGVVVTSEITGDEFVDSGWLREIGVIDQDDSLISTSVVTSDFLGEKKDFGGGWLRGGAESFYKICEIVYETDGQIQTKLIAYKAIHSMGDIKSKMITEAVWMSHMASLGMCAEVYAVGSGTIVKQFLEEDPVEEELNDEEYSEQMSDIIDSLHRVGLTSLESNPEKIEVIQNQGRLMLIDLGSGDISGSDASTFIQNIEN